MTPLERAEKICSWFECTKSEFVKEVADQIEEAEREALSKQPLASCYCIGKKKYIAELCRGCHCRIGYEWESHTIKEIKEKTWNAARDKAVGIVTDAAREFFTQEWLADRLREMKP